MNAIPYSTENSSCKGSDNVLSHIDENSSELTVLQINVEGLTKAKCEYLQKLAEEYGASILSLQETHVAPNTNISKFIISGFNLASQHQHNKYGLSIYIKSNILQFCAAPPIIIEDTVTIAVNINGFNIYNTYKPPYVKWEENTLVEIAKPALITGDFNSHNTTWGYDISNEDGEVLLDWISASDLYILQDLKGPHTSWSARWNAGYNLDLSMITLDDDGIPISAERSIIGSFPNSQYRVIMIKIGLSFQLNSSQPISRWNFRKANWEQFKEYIEKNINRIPRCMNALPRFQKLFFKAAKINIPRGFRKNYIPGWTAESEEL